MKLHKNVTRFVLEIYCPNYFQQNQNYQVTWLPYDVVVEFVINATVKLPKNQKRCNFVKDWYIRTKFYQDILFKDWKLSEMNFLIFSKIFPNFRVFPIFNYILSDFWTTTSGHQFECKKNLFMGTPITFLIVDTTMRHMQILLLKI